MGCLKINILNKVTLLEMAYLLFTPSKLSRYKGANYPAMKGYKIIAHYLNFNCRFIVNGNSEPQECHVVDISTSTSTCLTALGAIFFLTINKRRKCRQFLFTTSGAQGFL